MKKLFIISLMTLTLIVLGGTVKAATFKITASKTKVNPNGSFNISVGGNCIGRVNLSIRNGTLSTNSVWVEQNYQTIRVKAGSSGSVTIIATPTAGFSDANANEYKPGSRSISVKINSTSTDNKKTSTNTSSNQTKNKNTSIKEKSNNNLLSSLKTDIGTLEPKFNSNISEYSIKLQKDAQTISVSANSQDSKAKVNGTGKINLEPGDNIINITVTAENNSKKTYTIKANVDETPQVYLKYKDTKIGVVRNLKNVKVPEGFSKKQHVVNDNSIWIFNNEKFSIIYGIDDKNEKNFYIIDTEKNECKRKIIPITIDNHFFYLVDIEEEKEGFEISSIKIEDKEIEGYKFKTGFNDYFLLSVINNSGENVEYLYEIKEGTIQLYLSSAPIDYSEYKELVKKVENKQIMIYVLITLLLVNIICLFYLNLKIRKGKVDEKDN